MNQDAPPASGIGTPRDEVRSHALFEEVLTQVGPQILDQLPQRAAINVAATCWAGLLTLLRHGRRVVRGDVEWAWTGNGSRRGSNSVLRVESVDRFSPARFFICLDERLVTPVLELSSVDGLLRGLAGRICVGTSYVGRLVLLDDAAAYGAHVDVQDARALYDAAVEAGVDDNELQTSFSALARVLEASTDPGMAPVRVRRLCCSATNGRPVPGSNSMRAAMHDGICAILETRAVCGIIEELCFLGLDRKELNARRAMNALLANAHSLRVLDIRDCDIGAQGDAAVARLVRGSASLRELHLAGIARASPGRRTGINTISKAVFKIGTVKVFKLEEQGLGAVDAFMAYGAGAVEHLSLQRFGGSKQQLAGLVTKAADSQLVELTIGPCRCSSQGDHNDILAPLLATSNRLHRLELNSCDFKGYFRLFAEVARNSALPLERLHLSSRDAQDCSAIASMLAATSTLVDLRLTRMGLTDAAAEDLERGLKSSTLLRILDVSGNCFGPRAFEKLLQAVAGCGLEVFSMVDNKSPTAGVVTIGDELSRSTTLRVLQLGRDTRNWSFPVELHGLDSFADGLAHNNTLRALSIEHLRCKGSRLAGALRSNRALRSLSLHKTGLTDDDAPLLADALKSNRDLLVLRLTLDGESGKTVGVKCMKEALRTNRVLQLLCLIVDGCSLHSHLRWEVGLPQEGCRYPRIVVE